MAEKALPEETEVEDSDRRPHVHVCIGVARVVARTTQVTLLEAGEMAGGSFCNSSRAEIFSE